LLEREKEGRRREEKRKEKYGNKSGRNGGRKSVVRNRNTHTLTDINPLTSSALPLFYIAVCVVEGGPDYRCLLSGESSTIGFSLDRSVIDFKTVLFTSKKEEELLIQNTGKVVFNYTVLASNDAVGLFDVVPSSGTAHARTRTHRLNSPIVASVLSHFCLSLLSVPQTVYQSA
jgi:hypothetical protein